MSMETIIVGRAVRSIVDVTDTENQFRLASW